MKKKIKYIYYGGETHGISPYTIKIFRRIIGFSQRDIANELGTSRETISNWENGFTAHNFRIERWYIEHGLTAFNADFEKLIERVDECGIYDKRPDGV